MDVDIVINQLRTYCPLFQGRVAGGAAWEMTAQQVWMPQPAAYVIPGFIEADANPQLTGLRQELRQTISVMVDLSGVADRRAQAASTDAVGPALKAVMAALLWFQPSTENASNGYYFGGAEPLQENRARVLWRFDFVLKVWISQFDGFNPSAVPFDITADVVDQAVPPNTLIAADAQLPQP